MMILCRAMHYGSRHTYIENFFMLGVGAKCNELLKIYCIFFDFFVFVGASTYPSARCVQS